MADWGNAASPIQEDKWGSSASVVIEPAQQQSQAQAAPQGLFDRISTDYKNRLNEGQQAINAYDQGKQGAGLTALDYLGKVGAGTAADTFVEGVKSAASYAPQGVKDAVNSGISSISNSPAGDAVRYIGAKYTNYAKDNPDTARHIEAAGNILGLGLPEIPIRGAAMAGSALDAAGTAVKDTANVARNAVANGLEKVPFVDNALGKTVRTTADHLKEASQANYDIADKSGAVLSPKVTNDVIAKAESFGTPDAMVMATKKPTLANDLADGWSGFKDQPMPLQRGMALDQHLTDLLDHSNATDKNGLLNSQGREVMQIRQTLRDHLDNAIQNGTVQGDATGIEAYRTATKDWAAMRQVSEIQRIIDRASYMDNPATALKTGFRNIAVNPSRLSQFPKNVRPAIMQASRDGDLSNIMRTEIGSRLISTMAGTIAGSAAGPLGAAIGTATGFAASRGARNIAEKMQMSRANNVMDAIAQNSSLGKTTRVPLSKSIRNPLTDLAGKK